MFHVGDNVRIINDNNVKNQKSSSFVGKIGTIIHIKNNFKQPILVKIFCMNNEEYLFEENELEPAEDKRE